MAQAVQTRCRGCGEFVAARPEVGDWAAEERAYRTDWTEHDCAAAYDASVGPRAGEWDAYVASVELDDGELVEVTVPLVAEVPPPVAARAETPADDELVSLAEVMRRAAAAARPRTPQRRPPLVEVTGQAWAAAMADQVVAEATEITRTRPAAWPAGAGAQRALFTLGEGTDGAARPGRWGDPGHFGSDVRPAAYVPDAPARRRPAAGPRRGRGGDLPGARVGRDRDAATPRARGGWRLSRLLRWFQADDPRLARVLEGPARILEAIERAYAGD